MYVDPTGEIAWVPILAGGLIATELTLSALDLISLADVWLDPCSSWRDRGVSLAGLLLGVGAPGGGYGAAGRAVDASIPVGRRTQPGMPSPHDRRIDPHMQVPPGTNAPTNIGGREYTGHALDSMQARGFTPSVVENVIRTGRSTAEGREVSHYDPVNNITAITDATTGRVVTVKRLKMGDRLQIEGMTDLIKFYDEQRLLLHALVSNLDGKSAHLEGLSDEWHKQYSDLSLRIEIQVARLSMDKEEGVQIDRSDAIATAVATMRDFLSSTLSEMPEEEDISSSL